MQTSQLASEGYRLLWTAQTEAEPSNSVHTSLSVLTPSTGPFFTLSANENAYLSASEAESENCDRDEYALLGSDERYMLTEACVIPRSDEILL
jgi:hypothetical protein